jgi:DNA primase
LIKKTGARRISLVFDGDEAGRKAAYKALHGLLPLEVEIDVVSLPGGDDPCDLLVRDGASAFTAQLEQAQSWFDFLLTGLRGLRGIELSREVDRVLELMMRLSKPVHRDARIAEFAKALGLPVAGLRAQLDDLPATRAAVREARSLAQARPQAPAAVSVDRLLVTCFEEMLGAVLIDAGVFPMVRAYLERCPDDELLRVFTAIAALYDEPESAIDVSSVLSFLADDPARNRVEPATHVPVDEDYTPKRLVEAQIAFLSRRERDARFHEEHRAFRDLETQMLREKGEHAAASDPALIDLARRLAYEHDTTPSTNPQSADVEDPIHHG